jgi:hypothetical protein
MVMKRRVQVFIGEVSLDRFTVMKELRASSVEFVEVDDRTHELSAEGFADTRLNGIAFTYLRNYLTEENDVVALFVRHDLEVPGVKAHLLLLPHDA